MLKKFIKIFYCFILLYGIGTHLLFSQTTNFKTYSVEDGLPQSQVTTIYQGKNGYLWFGTLGGGICRYDGNEFVNYLEKDGLSSDIINCVYEDRNGNLWIGTDRGLSLHNPSFAYQASEKDKLFKNYTTYDGLCDNTVNEIIQDKKGNIWIGTNQGLSKINHNEFNIEKIPFQNYKSHDGWSFNRIQALFEDKQGNIWFGTYGMGVNAVIGYHLKNQEPIFIHFSKSDGLLNNRIWSITEDLAGNIWFGTDGDGICILNNSSEYKDKELKLKWSYLNTSNGLINNVINTLQRDQKGEIWIGTNKGINSITEVNRKLSIDRKEHKNDHFKHFDKNEGLSNSTILSCFEDIEGNVWFGTDGGGASKYIRRMFTTLTEKDGLSSNIVMSILQTPEGDMWYGTYGYGLNKRICECIYENGGSVLHFTKDNGFSNNLVMCSLEDISGNLWFGTYGGGINKLTLENALANKFQFDKYINNQGLNNNMIMAIFQDKGRNIWFGTYGGGVSKLPFDQMNSKNPVFQNYAGKQGITNNKIMSVNEDKEGNIWLGTFGGGANMLTFANGATQNPIVTVISTKEGLTNNRVISILEDTLSNIWLATYGGGICVLRIGNTINSTNELISLKDNEDMSNNLYWTYITRASGLTDDRIALMEFDDAGNLWAGTNNGMNKIIVDYGFNEKEENPVVDSSKEKNENAEDSDDLPLSVFNKIAGKMKIKDIKNYGIEEGFIGSECNHNAVHKDFTGNLFFGTVNGVIQYYSDEDATNSIPPQTNITSIKLNFEKPDWSMFTDSIDVITGLPYQLELSYTNNHLTFEYIGISLTIPEKVRYQFKLDGFDKDWAPVTKETKATYSNIPHGKFTFQVIASNNDGVWNTEPTNFSLVILPPFWKTWWFYALSICLGIITFLSFIKIREKNLLNAKKNLEKQVQLRTIELSNEKEKVEKANLEISQQNIIVNQKNTEITDSIKYAKQIQSAIMVPLDKIYRCIPHCFIYYLPKDIVSGDFYFFRTVGSNGSPAYIIAAVDCTGHGVPGAFMSMIGNNLLHQIVSEKGITKPSEILNLLDDGVRTALRQESEESSAMDGMDIAICKIDLRSGKLEYSGAHRPIVIIRKECEPDKENHSVPVITKSDKTKTTTKVIKADKRGIGGMVMEKRNYTNHEIQLNKGDCFYIFSDGIHDQFGGRKRKKYTSTKLREFLSSIYSLDMKQQQQKLERELRDWMAYEEQIDDILVIGVRI